MVIAALLSSLSLLASPQDVRTDPEQVLPEIVVEATRGTEALARRYVETISVSPRFALSLATWHTPLCLKIVNLGPSTTGALAAQIEGRAANLGVEVQPAGCEPNVTVVATADGSATATSLVEVFPDAFKASDGPTQLDSRALRRFSDHDRPVRWWIITAPYDTKNRKIIVPFNGARAPERRSLPGEMFGVNDLQALVSTVVVIDARLTGDVSVSALGDYIAMVVLAEVDAEAEFTDHPTILNLFSDAERAIGLSDWDLRYLNALYSARVNARNTRLQRGDIARLMAASIGSARGGTDPVR